MRATVLGQDDHLGAMVSIGMNFLASRPEAETMAEYAMEELSGKWAEVRRLILGRIRAEGENMPLPDPAELIDALCDVAMMANGVMWVYLAVQGTLTVGGDEAAMNEFKRMLNQGPLA